MKAALAFSALICLPPATPGLSGIETQERGATSPAPNTLSTREKAAGWNLLFDGKDLTGWRGAYGASIAGIGWVIEDGALRYVPEIGRKIRGSKDLLTVDQYADFDLRFEWRISSGGNSGVKYFLFEPEPRAQGVALGHEYQLLDDDKHPDAKQGKNGNRTAGSLYDLIAPKDKVVRPVGEYNESRVVVQGSHVEHWLNGKKVLEYDRSSPEYKTLLKESKYKDIPGFGEIRKGNILLQSHGDEVWFRNIKLRELPSK